MMEGLEQFCDFIFNQTDQHVDSRDIRIQKDAKDVKVLHQFLIEHNTFEDVDNL